MDGLPRRTTRTNLRGASQRISPLGQNEPDLRGSKMILKSPRHSPNFATRNPGGQTKRL